MASMLITSRPSLVVAVPPVTFWEARKEMINMFKVNEMCGMRGGGRDRKESRHNYTWIMDACAIRRAIILDWDSRGTKGSICVAQRFPSHESLPFRIYDVVDVSANDCKRCRANMIVGRGLTRQEYTRSFMLTAREPRRENRRLSKLSVKIRSMVMGCAYLYAYERDDVSHLSIGEYNEKHVRTAKYCPKRRFRLGDVDGFMRWVYSHKEECQKNQFCWRAV